MKKALIAFAVCGLMVGLQACDDTAEGAREDAQDIGQATGEAVQDAGQATGQALQNAGQAIENAATPSP